ncbi:MAG: endonuclease III domain-containing protein [Calditrichaeota bacterium]|nr:endonuclease III domain-containing protein [Calditrichota bacterium]
MSTPRRRNADVSVHSRKELLERVYETLFEQIGPRHWWPGETPFEVMVGAILTQNTAWANVEKAIRNLKAAGLLDPLGLYRAEQSRVAELIRPSGYYNQKAAKLKRFVKFFVEEYGADLEKMKAEPLDVLRRKLLQINGIGPETADSILLYALDKPVFVVDAYTRRIFSRHGWVEPTIGYEELREFFESALPKDVKLFNEYHALLVYVGHHFCKRKPQCEACPLQPFLPQEGARP